LAQGSRHTAGRSCVMQQPMQLEMTQPQMNETWRPTRKLVATFLLAVLGLVAVVCLFDSGSMPHGTVTGALVNAMGARGGNPVSMNPNPPRNAAPPTSAQTGTPRAAANELPPLHTFRVETPPAEDPTVDCWLDPNTEWNAKPDYLCASRAELAKRVDLEDSY